MAFFLEQKNKIWLGRFSSFEATGLVSETMTARFGGVSKPPRDELNLAMHVGDEVDDVFKNRRLLAEALNLDVEKICTADQVHGDTIYRVQSEDAGRGVHAYNDAIESTDALMTNVPGVPLMMCFADCVPIMFLDTENKAVAIAHGGWKGTVKHISEKTLLKMGEEYGTKPEKCLAAIGPSIGPCCFAVGDDVKAEFVNSFPDYCDKLVITKNGETHIDLWQANRLQLLAAGMKDENIDTAEVCTACNSKMFFSYRADGGVTGRLAAMIALKQGR